MNDTIEEVQELSQKTLAINNRNRAKSENFRTIENRQKNNRLF